MSEERSIYDLGSGAISFLEQINSELRAALDVAMAESDRWRALALEAGRVVEASRRYNERPYGVENGSLRIGVAEAIYAYDEALKARE